jgi:general stress protein 26
MNQISKNPKVCLYYCSFPEVHGLAITGKMEVVEDEEIRKTLWQEDWVRNFKGGLNDPNYTVLMVKPFLARGFYKMKKYEFAIT